MMLLNLMLNNFLAVLTMICLLDNTLEKDIWILDIKILGYQNGGDQVSQYPISNIQSSHT